jgi:hypothetical protein
MVAMSEVKAFSPAGGHARPHLHGHGHDHDEHGHVHDDSHAPAH